MESDIARDVNGATYFWSFSRAGFLLVAGGLLCVAHRRFPAHTFCSRLRLATLLDAVAQRIAGSWSVASSTLAAIGNLGRQRATSIDDAGLAGATALASSPGKSRRLARASVNSLELAPLRDSERGKDDDEGDDADDVDERSPLTRSAKVNEHTRVIPAPPPVKVPKVHGLEAGTHALLGPGELQAVCPHLPSRCGGKDLVALFSTSRDGYSLQTLYARAQHCGPTFVVVQTAGGVVLAGFASRDWSGSDVIAGGAAAHFGAHSHGHKPPRDGPHTASSLSTTGLLHAGSGGAYFGSGESFVATLRPGAPSVHRWTRFNNYFQLARSDCLAFGGGSLSGAAFGPLSATSLGHAGAGAGAGSRGRSDSGASGPGEKLRRGGFALHLDGNLEWGYSGPSETFGTLASLIPPSPDGSGGGRGGEAESDGGRFKIVRVDVYGFVMPGSSAAGAAALRVGGGSAGGPHAQGVSNLSRSPSTTGLLGGGLGGAHSNTSAAGAGGRRWA